jgi:anti-sigma factor ChrR (cupin superfamily)
MSDDPIDGVEFDELVALALAQSAATADGPDPLVKSRLMARIADTNAALPAAPDGFAFRYAADTDWQPHPVPGIRMKVLAMNAASGYVTLMLDVSPGTRFPPHHHSGAEECYVLTGSLYTCGRRLGPGDFVHADGGTDHGELFTSEGCQVLLIVPPEDGL